MPPTTAFEGGGTAFWKEDGVTESLFCKVGDAQYEDGNTDAPTLSIQPSASVGVLSNGSAKHASRAVIRCVRHVLVLYHAEMASFPMYAAAAPKIKIDPAEPHFCQDLRRLH